MAEASPKGNICLLVSPLQEFWGRFDAHHVYWLRSSYCASDFCYLVIWAVAVCWLCHAFGRFGCELRQ